MTDITLSDTQAKAVRDIVEWFRDPHRVQPTYYLAGFAGVGKSTVVRHIVDELGLSFDGPVPSVVAATYTAKAALVLSRMGTPATTIHKLIYITRRPSKAEVDVMKRKVEQLKAECLGIGDAMARLIAEAEIARHEDAIRGMYELKTTINPMSAARDAKLIILDECFVGCTPVDTPTGSRPISELKVGNDIINAVGVDRVLSIIKKECNSVAKIRFGEKTVICSENHKFFTDRGIVIASRLKPGDKLVKTATAMRLLQKSNNTAPQCRVDSEVLRKELFAALVDAVSGIQGKNIYNRVSSKVWGGSETLVKFRKSGSIGSNRSDSPPQSNITTRCEEENKLKTTRDWTSAAHSGGQWTWADETAKYVDGKVGGRMDSRVSDIVGEKNIGISDALQSRYSKSSYDDSNRVGWPISLLFGEKRERQKERDEIDGIRVEGIEILELGHPELDKFRDADGKLYLYDIQAERHHSFSVEGVLVHNCSMVNESMGRDLLSFDTPILVVGDPGQLPPIRGTGFFTAREPDTMLTEIHRQAWDSPIVRLATMARQGQPIPFGRYSDTVWKMSKEQIADPAMLLSADIVLCGLNRTRYMLNNEMRRAAGRGGILPLPEDKLICLKNSYDLGLVNGLFLTMRNLQTIDADRFQAILDTEDGETVGAHGDDDEEAPAGVPCYAGHFLDHVVYDKDRSHRDHWMKQNLVESTFGYAISVHKAQGSGFSNIIFWDDGWGAGRPEQRRQLVYTAITRAISGLLIVE